MNIRYDILYLRFLSILTIIFYHFNSELIKGGYLGVDILLIITGYLNINSILSKKSKENYSYIDYIIKRSNRLIPSSLVVLYLCKSYVSDYNEIISSLFFLSNYYYYKKRINYFHQFDLPSPLLHYWCLSLEYQFYFIIPIILRIIYTKYIMFILFITSLFIYLYKEYENYSYCYYCFLPRLYQFTISYFITTKSKETKQMIFMFLFTILHIVIIVWFNNEYVNIHIIFTIIISIVINSSYLNHNLSNYFFYFSNISYSLYLVHYPVIIIYKFNIFYKINLIIIISIILYILNERYLLRLLNRTKDSNLLLIYFVLVLLCIYNNNKIDNKKLDNSNKIWNEFNKYRKSCKINASHYNKCSTILLIGDSHVDQWISGIYNYFHKISVVIYFIHVNGMKDISSYRIKHIVEKVKRLEFIELIIMCNFKYNIEFRNDVSFIHNIDRYYIHLQRLLLNYSNNIVVLNDNPHLLTPANNCFSSKEPIQCYCILGINCTISELPIFNHTIRKCDMNKYLCNNNKCSYIINNKIVYVDTHHLTPYITKYLANDLIDCLHFQSKIKIKCNKEELGSCYYYSL